MWQTTCPKRRPTQHGRPGLGLAGWAPFREHHTWNGTSTEQSGEYRTAAGTRRGRWGGHCCLQLPYHTKPHNPWRGGKNPSTSRRRLHSRLVWPFSRGISQEAENMAISLAFLHHMHTPFWFCVSGCVRKEGSSRVHQTCNGVSIITTSISTIVLAIKRNGCFGDQKKRASSQHPPLHFPSRTPTYQPDTQDVHLTVSSLSTTGEICCMLLGEP